MDNKEWRASFLVKEKHYAPEMNKLPEDPKKQKRSWFIGRRTSVDSVGNDRRASIDGDTRDRRASVSSVEDAPVGSPIMSSVLQGQFQARTTPQAIQDTKKMFREFDFK